MTIRYVVKDEHTLGYIVNQAAQFPLMGVFASSIDGHSPSNGPVSTAFSNIRPATAEDFERFRVVPPPDFSN